MGILKNANGNIGARAMPRKYILYKARLESKTCGELMPCELDPKYVLHVIVIGNLHFSHVEQEMEIIALVLLRLTNIFLRSQKLVKVSNFL